MTDATADFGQHMAKKSIFAIEETYWGYKIRSGRGPSFAVAFGQAVSFFFGVCLLTAAIGILALPALFFDGELGAMRIGSAALFGAMAAYLLWFASRGTQTEIHVDTSLAEIREVVCNRAGRPTTMSAYSFDAIAGIYLAEKPASELSQIVLRYHDTNHDVVVAEGTEAQLIPLRNQLGQDLLGH